MDDTFRKGWTSGLAKMRNTALLGMPGMAKLQLVVFHQEIFEALKLWWRIQERPDSALDDLLRSIAPA